MKKTTRLSKTRFLVILILVVTLLLIVLVCLFYDKKVKQIENEAGTSSSTFSN